MRGRADADRFVAEQVQAGRLMGLPDDLLPASTGEVADYLREIRPSLQLTGHARRGVRLVLAPPMPLKVELLTPARLGWSALASMAVGTLPGWARRMYLLPPAVGTLGAMGGLRTLRAVGAALPDSIARPSHARLGYERAAALSA